MLIENYYVNESWTRQERLDAMKEHHAMKLFVTQLEDIEFMSSRIKVDTKEARHVDRILRQ